MHEAGATVVAAQLLALFADPVLHRARLTHGREPFPGALHAFRFVQNRFPEGVLGKLSVEERRRLREAAVFFIRQVCLWEDATHYQVLGVSPQAQRQSIKEHYQALMALLHPDRQDAGSEKWPSNAAPRVNQAYAVLSDDSLRREYDTGLGKVAGAHRGPAGIEPQPVAASVRGAARGKGSASRTTRTRGILIGTAAVASLFFLNAWWANDLPDESSTLQRATPVGASSRWMHDTLSPSQRPRFIGSGERLSPALLVAEDPAKQGAPASRTQIDSSLIPDWWTRLTSPQEARPEPARVAEARSELVRIAQVKPEATSVAEVSIEPREDASAAQPKEPIRISSTSKPMKVAQASSMTEANVGDLELLVTNLVSHYESGDLDRLLGLFDSGTVGVVEAMNLRRDFDEFFRATRERSLLLQSISWDAANPATRARGQALLRASYIDRAERIERVVGLDLTIAWRDGRPRITRLSLFPHE
ncbi:MAG: J domain-containing protein [Betaproteobacteria bacterium]|nr:J domain-containing protein [Betaproteobacteria bacterium]